MKLLVIIVTYNAMKWVDRCFNSLIKSSVANDVFVIDNGSVDGTQNYIKTHYPNVLFHQNEENLGFGRANNIGMQYALDYGYDYVYLLNQDAWVDNDTFSKIINAFVNNSEFGIMSPLQMNVEKSKLDRNFLACISNCENLLGDLLSGNLKTVYELPMTMAAHWMISRKCLEVVGGFSPTFTQYGEDQNYAQRAFYWNFKSGIVPTTKAVHDREYRVESKQKEMHLRFTDEIAYLSNPNGHKNHIPWIIYNLYNFICILIKFQTLGYIYKTIAILRSYNVIRKNKLLSMKPCAFLRIKNV